MYKSISAALFSRGGVTINPRGFFLLILLLVSALVLMALASNSASDPADMDQVRADMSGFVTLAPSPSGGYRWMDVADQVYSADFRDSYDYDQATVGVSYNTVGESLMGELVAQNLKPNFAYQLKVSGTPSVEGNELIGLAGRWWEQVWMGSSWSGGANLNDKGDGSSPNPNDLIYFERRDIEDEGSDTGYHYKYTGYLVFAYFVTDSEGDAAFTFETGSSYHVLWKTSQRTRAENDGPLETVTFDPNVSEPAYDVDYGSQTVSIFGEWERLSIGGVDLAPGNYICKMVLTEESFHGTGVLSGTWAAAMTGEVSFTIVSGEPSQMAQLLISVEPSQAAYLRGQQMTFAVTVFNQLNPPLDSTLTLTVTGPDNYYYYGFQSVNVTADTVGEYKFSWSIPDAAGTYVVEVGLVPAQLTAYDAVWLKVA
jgi:hypothetical protein